MKSIKTLTVIAALAMVQMMSSCLGSNDSNYTVTDKYPYLFNAVLNISDGDMTLYPNQSATINWTFGNNTAEVQINGLKLPDGASFPALQLKDLPFTVNSRGWTDITARTVTPTSTSGPISGIVIDEFKFETASRQYNNLTFPPCVVFKYTVNNAYKIYALPSEIIEMGETVVTDQTGSQYKPSSSENLIIYYIELDPVTKKCYVVIQGAKFADKMPAMNMKFPGIPFTVNTAGHIIMDCAELTPALMGSTSDITAAGTPAPNFPITDFKGTYIPDYGLQISYKCTPTGKDGQPMGLYDVQFKCVYPTTSNTGTSGN